MGESYDEEDQKPASAQSAKPVYEGGYAVNARGEVIVTDDESTLRNLAEEERNS